MGRKRKRRRKRAQSVLRDASLRDALRMTFLFIADDENGLNLAARCGD
jgi:hypothetical protein